MNTREEVNEWERHHKDAIWKWESDYDIKPGVQVLTFFYTDNGVKSEKVFELPTPPKG